MHGHLAVELGDDRSYPIHIGTGIRETVKGEVASCLKDGRKVAVVTDENVAKEQTDLIADVFSGLPVLKLPAGENTKSVECLETVYDFLAGERMERSDRLVVFGGGVIGDLGGFAAATYLRGIEYIQVPSTLLAMVDSSVGGKTGVNLKAGKNLAGAFHHPAAVFIDTAVLETLPDREFAAGMAEVIKYGLLADAELFHDLIALGKVGPRHQELPRIIRECCRIKAEIVAADEKERAGSGGRALLNLGHTFGHAVENAAGYGEYLHGEAVGLGLVMAGCLSQERGWLSREDVNPIRELVELYSLPIRLKKPLPMKALIEAMKRDKKVRAGKLRFVAMEKIGKAVTVDDVDIDLVVFLWREFGATS